MRKFRLTAVITVFLLFSVNEVQAQTKETKLDQLKLIQAWNGTWQRVFGKDSVQVLEFRPFGKGFAQDLYLLVDGKKFNQGTACYTFSAKDGSFKVYSLMANGDYSTYLVTFTAENRWVQYQVQDFNPEKILGKGEGVLDSPTSYTATYFNLDGVKIAEGKWTKIK